MAVTTVFSALQLVLIFGLNRRIGLPDFWYVLHALYRQSGHTGVLGRRFLAPRIPLLDRVLLVVSYMKDSRFVGFLVVGSALSPRPCRGRFDACRAVSRFALGDDVITQYIQGIQFLPVCIMVSRQGRVVGTPFRCISCASQILLACINIEKETKCLCTYTFTLLRFVRHKRDTLFSP